MKDIYQYDAKARGAKGLVYIGEQILLYRRDNNTNEHPNVIDLPGGGIEGNESPFETFTREVKEEFGVAIASGDIVYSRKYASIYEPELSVYFIVAKIPASRKNDIVFGDEGSEWMLMNASDYLARDDAWDIFQERTIDYLNSVN